jgi:hypothetical protein
MRQRLFLLGLILLVASSAFAQSPETVLQVVTGTPPDLELMAVISGSARVELLRAGLDDQEPSLIAPEGDESAIRERALARGTDYIVQINFTGDSEGGSAVGDIDFDVTLYRTSDGAILASDQVETFVDLTLDSRVARAVRSLVYEAGVDGPRIVQAEPDDGDEGNGGGPDDTSGNGGQVNIRPPPPVVTTQGPPPRGVAVAVEGAPLLLVGGASDTFRYGVSGSVSTLYRPGFSRFGFEVGLRIGAMRLFQNEDIVGGQAYVGIAGAEVAVGNVYRSPTRISARASGGVAVITVVTESQDILAKAVPYASGGVEAIVAVWRGISVGILAEYVVVFEEQLPVMGVSPSVVLRLGP